MQCGPRGRRHQLNGPRSAFDGWSQLACIPSPADDPLGVAAMRPPSNSMYYFQQLTPATAQHGMTVVAVHALAVQHLRGAFRGEVQVRTWYSHLTFDGPLLSISTQS
jgi:hypothetical protein